MCITKGKVYVGETTRRLEQRMKEHQDACKVIRRFQPLLNMLGSCTTPIKCEEESCRQSQ